MATKRLNLELSVDQYDSLRKEADAMKTTVSGLIRQLIEDPSPHFSPAFYCCGGSGHVYCVALGRAPRHTVEHACGALGRAPCIHARLRRLATKTGEKCGLGDASLRMFAIMIPIRLAADAGRSKDPPILRKITIAISTGKNPNDIR
jgi:hypothetical protein